MSEKKVTNIKEIKFDNLKEGKSFPDKFINSSDIENILINNIPQVQSAWFRFQSEWAYNAYQSMKDLDKYLILVYLIQKTFIHYADLMVIISEETMYAQDSFEIDKINLIEISEELGIPKETVRRKINELSNDDSNKIESNEVVTSDGLSNTGEVTKTVDGKEVVVTGTNDSLKIQNEAKDLLKSNETENILDKVNKAEFTGVKVLTAPVSPVREDYPKTKAGLKAYINAKKEYIIKYKEFKKTQQNLIKPTDKNKNGLTALNTTDGLTSNNISSSKTIVLQRQIVRVNTPVQV